MFIRFQRFLFVYKSTKLHIVNYIRHYASISLNSQCSALAWNWQHLVLVHMNLPDSANSMYDVVKWVLWPLYTAIV